MKDVEILRDILESKVSNELFYNDALINIRNPEARQLFMEMRDDEMRHIIKLEQKIERLQAKNIISRLLPMK